MTIYGVPEYRIGKDFPGQGPFRTFVPKIIGPGGGKIKLALRAGRYFANQFRNRPSLSGSITGIAIGTGLSLDGSVPRYQGSNSYSQTYRSVLKRKYYYRRNKRNGRGRHCCNRCY